MGSVPTKAACAAQATSIQPGVLVNFAFHDEPSPVPKHFASRSDRARAAFFVPDHWFVLAMPCLLSCRSFGY